MENRMDSVKTSLISTSVDKLFYTKYKRSNRLQNSETTECDLKDSSMKTSITASENNKTSEQSTSEIVNEINLLDETSLKHTKGKYLKNYTNLEYSENDCEGIEDVSKVFKLLTKPTFHSNVKNTYRSSLKTYTNPRKCLEKNEVIESFGLPDTPIIPEKPLAGDCLDAEVLDAKEITIQELEFVEAPWCIIEFEENFINPQEIRIKPDPNTTIDDKLSNIQSTIVDEHAKRNKKILSPPNKSELIIENDRLTQEGLEVEICKVNMPRKGKLKDINYNEKSTIRPNVNYPIEDSEKDNSESRTLRSSNVIEEASMLENNTLSEKIDDSCSTRKLRSSTIHSTIKYDSDEDIESGKTKINFKSMEREQVLSSSDSETSEYSENKNKSNKIYNRFKHSLNSTTTDVFTPDSSESGRRNKFKNGKERYNLRSKEQEPLSSNKNTSTRTLRSKSCSEILFNDKIEPVKEKQLKVILHPLETTKDHHLVDNRKELNNSCGLLLEIVDIIPVSDESRPSSKLLQSKPFFNLFKNTLPKTLLVGGETRKTSRKFDWKSKYMNKSNNKDKNESLQQSEVKITNKLKSECKIDSIKKIGEVEGRKCKIFANEKLSEYLKPRSYKKKAFCVDTSLKSSNKTVETEVDGISIKKTAKNESPTDKLRNRTRKIIEIISEDITNPQESRFKRKSAENASSCEFLLPNHKNKENNEIIEATSLKYQNDDLLEGNDSNSCKSDYTSLNNDQTTLIIEENEEIVETFYCNSTKTSEYCKGDEKCVNSASRKISEEGSTVLEILSISENITNTLETPKACSTPNVVVKKGKGRNMKSPIVKLNEDVINFDVHLSTNNTDVSKVDNTCKLNNNIGNNEETILIKDLSKEKIRKNNEENLLKNIQKSSNIFLNNEFTKLPNENIFLDSKFVNTDSITLATCLNNVKITDTIEKNESEDAETNNKTILMKNVKSQAISTKQSINVSISTPQCPESNKSEENCVDSPKTHKKDSEDRSLVVEMLCTSGNIKIESPIDCGSPTVVKRGRGRSRKSSIVKLFEDVGNNDEDLRENVQKSSNIFLNNESAKLPNENVVLYSKTVNRDLTKLATCLNNDRKVSEDRNLVLQTLSTSGNIKIESTIDCGSPNIVKRGRGRPRKSPINCTSPNVVKRGRGRPRKLSIVTVDDVGNNDKNLIKNVKKSTNIFLINETAKLANKNEENYVDSHKSLINISEGGNLVLETLSTSGNIKIESPIDCGSPNVVKRGRGRPRKSSIVTIDEDDRNNEENLSANIQKSSIIFLKNESAKLPNKNEENHVDSHKSSIKDSADGNLVLETLSASGNIKIESPIDCGNPNVVKKGRGRPKKISIIKLDEDVGYNEENITESVQKSSNIFLNNESAKLTDKSGEKCVNSPQTSIKVSEDENLVIETFSTSGNIKIESPIDCGSPNVVKRGRGRPRKISIIKLDEDVGYNEENVTESVQKSSNIFLDNEYEKSPNKSGEKCLDIRKTSIKDSEDRNLVIETLSTSANIKMKSPIDCSSPNIVKRGRGRPRKSSIVTIDEDVGNNEENLTENFEKFSNMFLDNNSAKLSNKNGEKYVDSLKTSIKDSEDRNSVIGTLSTSENIKIESPIDCGSPNVVNRGRGRPRKLSIVELDDDVGNNEENLSENFLKSSNIFLNNESSELTNKSEEKCVDRTKSSIKVSEDGNLVLITLSTSGNIKMKSPIDCSSPNVIKRGRGRPRKSSIVTIDEDVANNEENITENLEKSSNIILNNESEKLTDKSEEKCVNCTQTSLQVSEDGNLVIETLSTSENTKIGSSIDCSSPNVVKKGRGRPRKSSIVTIDEDDRNNEENLTENVQQPSNIIMNNESEKLTDKSGEKCVNSPQTSIKVSDDENLVIETLSTNGNSKIESPIDCGNPNVVKKGRGRPRKLPIVELEEVVKNEGNLTENVEKPSNIILNNESEKLTDESEEKCVDCTRTSIQLSEDGNLVTETLSTSGNIKIESPIDYGNPNVVKKGRGRPRKLPTVELEEVVVNNEGNFTENVQQPSNIIMNNESEKLTDKRGDKCVDSPQTYVKVSEYENLVIETLSTSGNIKIESPIDCGNPNVVKKGRGRPRKLPTVELEEVVVNNEGNLTENVQQPSNIIMNNESEKLTDKRGEKCVDSPQTCMKVSEDENLVIETLSTSGNIKIEWPIDYGSPNVVKRGRGRPRKLPIMELEEVVVNNEGNLTENVQQPSNIIMNNESEKLTDKSGDKCFDSPQTSVKVSEDENLVIETLSTSGNIKIESPIDCGNPNVVKKGRGRPRKLPTVELEEVVVNNEGNLTENVQQPSNIIMNNESEKLTDKSGEKCVDSPQTRIKLSEDENLVIETLSTSGNIKIESPIDCGNPNVVKKGRGRPRKLPIVELEEVVKNEGNLTENVEKPSNIILNNESEKLTDESEEKCVDCTRTSIQLSEDGNLVTETLSTSGNIKIESPIDYGNPNVVKKGRGRPRKLPTVELEEVVVNNEGNFTENVQQPSNIIMNNESEKLTDKRGDKCVDSPQTYVKVSEYENLVIETLSTSGNIKIESPIDCGNPNVVKKGRGRPRKLPTVELEEVVVNNEGNLTENVQQPSNIIMNNESEKLTDKRGEKCVDSPQTCMKVSEDENLVIETLSTSGNIKIEWPIDYGSPNVVKRGRGRPRKLPIMELEEVVVNNEGNLTENVQQPSNIIMNNESEKLTDKSGDKCFDSPQTSVKVSEDENLVIETLSTSGNIKIESPIDCGNPNVVKKGRGRPRKLPTVELEEVVVNNEGNLTENVQQPSNIIMNNESEKLTDKSGEKCVDSPQTRIKLSEDENLVIETLSTSGNIKIESPIDCGNPNVVKKGRGRPRKLPTVELEEVVVNNEGNLTENVQQPSNIIMNNESEKLTDKSGEKCVDSPQTCIKLSEDENLVIETLSTSGNIKIESPIDCGSPNVVKRGRGRPRKTPILKLDDDYSKFDKNIHIFNENFFHGDSELHKKNVTSALSTMDIPRKEKSSEESKDTLESGEITDLQNEEIDKNNIEKITAQINDSDKDIDENDLNIHILCVKNNILIEKKDIINNSDITKELESTSSDNNSLVPLKNESTQKDIIESYRKHEEDITRSTGVDKTEYTENKNNIIEDTGIIEKFIPETTKDNDKITNDNTTNKYIEVDKDCMTTDSKNNTKNDETDLDNSALKKDEDSIVIKNKKVDEMELDKNTAADIDEPTIIEDDFDDEKKFTITDGSQTNKKDEILNIVASSDSTETVFDNERSNSDKTFLKITNTEIDIYIDLLSSPKSENNEENLYNEEDTSKTDNLCTETIEKKVETKSNISLGPTSGTITYSESDKTSLDQKIGIISDIKGISNDPNFKCPLEAPMIVKNEYEDKIISNKSIDLTKLLLNDKISETKDVLTDLHEIQYQIDSEEHSGKENISTRTRSKTNLGERIDGDVDDFTPQGMVRSNSSLGINRDECSDLFLKETKNLDKEIVTNCFIENTRAVVDENGIEILDTVEEEVSGSKIMKTLDENIGRKESIECIEEFNIGDIVWAQIGKFPYWPSLISEDPVTCSFKNIMKNRCAYHVKFFGDKGKRAWINSKKLIEYKNRDDLKTYYENLKNCKSAVELQGYIIKGYIVERWTKAVDEVEFVKSQNFTFEQMINYMDEESNQEVDEKKNSTMKKGKKRKQSLGLEELEDLDGLENKKIKLEVEESVPKQRQKKSIPELKYEHSSPGKLNEETEDFIVITDEQSEEKYKINSETFNNFGSYTLEEQRSLFKRNNLFKGIPKEKVCQYCFEFGEVLKCKGGCNGIYHPHCATEVSKHQTRKKPGRSPKIDTTEKVETIKIEKIESPSSPGNQLDADNNHVEIVTIPSRIYNTPPRKTFPPDFANMTLSERIDFKMKEIMKKFESTSYAEDFNESSSDENNKSSIRDSFPQENIDSDNNLRDDTKIKPIEHVTADSDNKSNIECIKRETDSPIKHITADSEYTDEVKLKKNRSKSKITKHITADSQDTLIDPKNFKCGFCAQDLDPYCFICNETSSKRGSYIRQKCSLYQCNRFYHPECLKLWPQTQWSVIQTTKNRYSQEEVDSFVCPQHVCHTCASDDPRAALSRCSWDKIVKCLCCPASYHSSNLCVPAGTEIITSTQIICPRHRNKYAKPYTINTTWCLLCNQGGKLICCETCPTSVHPECMTVNLTDDDKFICEDCESGRLPLYDEVVWVKLGYFKWWPALIIFPNEVPPNVLNAKHGLGEFVVKFFGTYNYYWINRGRAFLFQEGDNADTGPGNKKKVEAAFRRAVEEAVVAHKMKKQFKLTQSAESVNSMKPPPYIKIKVSKPVGNVRFMDLDLSNTTACDCNPSQPNPCGPDTNCLNRLLLTECNPEVCPAGKLCNNQSFEKREYPLLVPYKTETRGWGLKTLEPLKKGQFVIEYVGELIDDEEYQRRILKMHAQKEENFYFLTIHKDRMIDAGPKGNMARFMNHCCQPNCETQKWTVNGDTRVGLFATTDIPANTELTFNYNLECTGTEKKVCKCGAPNCSGFIGVKVKNESAETKKPKKERKKKEPEKPLVLPPCYLCEKRGKVSLCNNKICNKAYHLSCLKLEVSEGKKFICPWHYCNVCSKRTIRCCVKCLNSFCPSHSEGNVRYDKLLGFVCSKHDSMNVEDRCNTVKRKRNHPITDEDVVTSTTDDNDDDVSLLQRMKQSKKNKVEEGNNDSVIRETRNETVSSATETDFEGKFKLKRKKKTLRDKRLEKITANSVSHV